MTAAIEPVLAIDIGGTKIAAALVAQAQVLAREQVETPRSGRGVDIADAVGALASRLGITPRIGVATTGIVRDGVLTALNPTTLPIENNFPLADALQHRLGVRPLIINDAQAAGWGEYRFGAGQNVRAMCFVTVSTGIGGAFVLDGRLQTGARGLAGHIGHVVVEPDGPPCGCGRRGCIERLASGTAIAARAGAILGHPIAVPEVFAAAERGDAAAESIVDSAARYLARVLVNSVARLDLDCMVIGGGVGLATGFVDRVSHHLASEPEIFRRPLYPARLGADAGLVGVAALTSDEEFFHLA